MSYAHSWGWEAPLVDSKRFSQWSRDVALLLQHYPTYAHWYGEFTVPYLPVSDHWALYKICGPLGTGEPIITESEVAFNGNEETQNSYETFQVAREDLDRPDGGSYRVAWKPYDLLMTAALVRLTSYFPTVEVSSALGFGAFQQGTQFCRDIFGEGINPVLERERSLDRPGGLQYNTIWYPNPYYLEYIVAWYRYLHPQEAIRSATFEGRVCIETKTPHDPQHPLFFDLLNDSRQCVWDVRTGIVPEILIPNVGVVFYGSKWPEPDYIGDEGMRLAKQFGGTSYQLGTRENDPSVMENDGSQPSIAYFRNGTILFVRMPTQVTRNNGTTTQVKGILEYRVIQTQLKENDDSAEAVSKEEYQQLYTASRNPLWISRNDPDSVSQA